MRKKIAFIAAGLDTLYMQQLVKVIAEKTASLNYDLIIITHFVNFYNGTPYIEGEEKIYSLTEKITPDGAIIAGSSFLHTELVEKTEKILLKNKIPAVALDYESSVFPNIVQDNRKSFALITEHFINEHGMNKILCLTGPEGNIHSEQRVCGYRDALEKNGIQFDENLVVYGDFWIDAPKKLAVDIAEGRIPFPQAVVCGNDYMAFQLCISLAEAGIKVPEDIAVGGYDGNPDIQHFSVSPTTVSGGYTRTGVESVMVLHGMISGEKCSTDNLLEPCIHTGTSCGCRCDGILQSMRAENQFNIRQKNTMFMCSDYSSVMNSVRTMDDWTLGILSHMYHLDNLEGLSIYLYGDSQTEEKDSSRSVQCIFRYEGQYISSGDVIAADHVFPESDNPAVYLCTPLHYQEHASGFCVRRSTYDSFSFEPYYGEFCQVISDALERLRQRTEEADRKQANTGNIYFSRFQALRDRIYEEPQLEWNADEQAGEAGISVSHFRHLYKSFFSSGFNADVISARLALARRLLKTTDISVNETAQRCGYDDASYFMKLFKKQFGITALAYRKR